MNYLDYINNLLLEMTDYETKVKLANNQIIVTVNGVKYQPLIKEGSREKFEKMLKYFDLKRELFPGDELAMDGDNGIRLLRYAINNNFLIYNEKTPLVIEVIYKNGGIDVTINDDVYRVEEPPYDNEDEYDTIQKELDKLKSMAGYNKIWAVRDKAKKILDYLEKKYGELEKKEI